MKVFNWLLYQFKCFFWIQTFWNFHSAPLQRLLQGDYSITLYMNLFILHPKIPILFHCKNRFLVITKSILKIESFKRCQNDRTNEAVIWYFHHHFVLFKLAKQSSAPDIFFRRKMMLENFTICVQNYKDFLTGYTKSHKNN